MAISYRKDQDRFGPLGLPLSPLCFGTMQFGAGASESQSAALYESCRQAGINFFDTAFVYNEGRAEEILGKLIQSEREQLILVTKAGAVGGSSAQNIRTQLETSLSRLGLDYIDVFFLHMFDPDIPLEDTFQALAALKAEGKFFHLGVSNFAAWQIMKAQSIAKQNGFPEIEFIQPMYNLVKRQAEVEILPMASDQNMKVISYSPLGGGLLTGKYTADTSNNNARGRLDWDTKYKTRYGVSWMHEAAEKLTALAQEMGLSPATLAVAWAAYHPAITAPIISARTASQLLPSLHASNIKFDDELYQKISAFTPRPAPATDRLEEQG